MKVGSPGATSLTYSPLVRSAVSPTFVKVQRTDKRASHIRSCRSRCHRLLPHCRSTLSRPVDEGDVAGRALWDQAG
jgi:hypothetical protein